ncbi:hypothetical protein J4417_04820 [Candidatus Woesearchaeota archaeon]|nr:hypothetical protein [Candidatus Woesearchaeota archaeon]
MYQRHHKRWLIFVVCLVILSLFSVRLTDAKFSDLTSEQKQVYWKCLENSGCSQLLKNKEYADYKTCSLNCIGQASQFSPEQNWCEDSDGQDFFTKGTVKSYLYPSGKEDYGYTFGVTTYLMEGICKNNKYLRIQKDCKELGNFEYKDGACVKKEEFWEVGFPWKKLEMTNNNAPADNLFGEPLSDIITYLSSGELKSLSDGKFLTDNKEYSYFQYLFLSPPDESAQPKGNTGIIKYTTNSLGQTADFLYFKAGKEIARYRTEFYTKNIAGSIDYAEIAYTEFINKKIKLFGTEYTIISATPMTDSPYGIKLILNDGKKNLDLEDSNIIDNLFSATLKVNGESIDGTEIKIEGIVEGGSAKINMIEVKVIAQKDYFVSANTKLSEAIKQAGEKPEALFTENWDIRYDGLTTENTHDIKLSAPSNSKYALTWYDGDNNKVEMPLVYAKAGQTFILGEEVTEKALVIKEGIPINKDDYFVVTGGNPVEGNAQSYLLQYKGSDNTGKTSPKIKFKSIGSGETLEYSLSQDNLQFDLNLGKYSFEVIPVQGTEEDNFPILVDLDTTEKNILADPIITTFLESEQTEVWFEEEKYTLKLMYVDPTYVKLEVNGEKTDKLSLGNTIKIGGLEIEVVEILYQSYAGGVHAASFLFKELPSNKGIGKDQPPVIDNYGTKIGFSHYPASESFVPLTDFSLTITAPNGDDYDNQKPSEIKLILKAAEGAKIDITSFAMDGNLNTLITPVNEPTIASGYTSLGGKLTLTTPQDSPAEFIYGYPEKQRLPKVKIIAFS